MALSATPFVAQNGSHPASLFRQAVSSIVPDVGGLAEWGDLAVTQTGTASMAVQIGVGRAWVPGTNTANPSGFNYSSQGQYFAFNDAAVTRTISAADATNPRIDLVCLTITDSAYTGSTNTADFVVVTGTPAASPTVPSAPANSLVLAQVSVAANATSITNSNITGTAYPITHRHAEFTGPSQTTTAGAGQDFGSLTLDPAHSYLSGFATGGASGNVTVNEAGIYLVTAIVSGSNSGTSGNLACDLNGSSGTVLSVPATFYGRNVFSGCFTIDLRAGQYLHFSIATSGSMTWTGRIKITKVKG